MANPDEFRKRVLLSTGETLFLLPSEAKSVAEAVATNTRRVLNVTLHTKELAPRTIQLSLAHVVWVEA